MTSPGGPSYTPLSLRDFDEAVVAVEQLVVKVRDEFNRLVDLVQDFLTRTQREFEDSWIDRFFEVFTDDISDALDELRRLVEHARTQVVQLLDRAQSSVAGSAPVASLFRCAYDLAGRVNAPLTGLDNRLASACGIVAWRGPAKETYEIRVVGQQRAVASAAEKVQALGIFLGEAATANVSYMADLGERLGRVYGALVTACVDLTETAAGAVTQAVITLAHFSEVIGTAVAESIGYTTALGARIADVLHQILVLEVNKSDFIGLAPGGHWPATVNP